MSTTQQPGPRTFEQVATLGPRRQRFNVLVDGQRIGWVIGTLGADWNWTARTADGTPVAGAHPTRALAAAALHAATPAPALEDLAVCFAKGQQVHHDDLGACQVLEVVPHNVLVQSDTNPDVAAWVCPQALRPVVQIGA